MDDSPAKKILCVRSLKGKTPAEAAGITIEGANEWETVIQNGARLPKREDRRN